MTRWDIIGIGSISVDDLLYVDHYPQLNEKIVIKQKQRQGGGLTATALVAASRQGAKTAYCGCMGEDELSLYSIRELENEGVDTSIIQHRSDSKTAYSIILVDAVTGGRTIISDLDGVREPDCSVITEELITSCRVLFIDYFSYHMGTLGAGIARSHGIPVVADIETAATLPDQDKFLNLIDHLIINMDVASLITGKQDIKQIMQSLSNSQRAACVITAGDQGCWYSEYGGEIFFQPAYKVEVVDTTGCGDVFHGSYAAALARGENIHDAIRVAAASAALKATLPGGRQGIPNLQTVQRFIQTAQLLD